MVGLPTEVLAAAIGPPSTELIVAALGVIGAFIAAAFAAPFLMRKVNRDLVKAQADKTEAEKDEILDRQAGVWIKRYEDRLAELDDYLDRQDELHAIHAAWDYNVLVALRHANIQTVDPPPLKPPKRARTRRVHHGSEHDAGIDMDSQILEGHRREGS